MNAMLKAITVYVIALLVLIAGHVAFLLHIIVAVWAAFYGYEHFYEPQTFGDWVWLCFFWSFPLGVFISFLGHSWRGVKVETTAD